jgi:hypothetical protein
MSRQYLIYNLFIVQIENVYQNNLILFYQYIISVLLCFFSEVFVFDLTLFFPIIHSLESTFIFQISSGHYYKF